MTNSKKRVKIRKMKMDSTRSYPERKEERNHWPFYQRGSWCQTDVEILSFCFPFFEIMRSFFYFVFENLNFFFLFFFLRFFSMCFHVLDFFVWNFYVWIWPFLRRWSLCKEIDNRCLVEGLDATKKSTTIALQRGLM